jgi:hypothetical protein
MHLCKPPVVHVFMFDAYVHLWNRTHVRTRSHKTCANTRFTRTQTPAQEEACATKAPIVVLPDTSAAIPRALERRASGAQIRRPRLSSLPSDPETVSPSGSQAWSERSDCGACEAGPSRAQRRGSLRRSLSDPGDGDGDANERWEAARCEGPPQMAGKHAHEQEWREQQPAPLSSACDALGVTDACDDSHGVVAQRLRDRRRMSVTQRALDIGQSLGRAGADRVSSPQQVGGFSEETPRVGRELCRSQGDASSSAASPALESGAEMTKKVCTSCHGVVFSHVAHACRIVFTCCNF